jgi:hypothetical protein
VTARTTISFALLIALVASACGAVSKDSARRAPTARTPALYTVGKTLVGAEGDASVELAAAPVTPLAGWLTPAAVPSPDGRYLAYNAWHEIRKDDPALSWADQGISTGDPLARPSIRLHDLETGADETFVDGGFSLAWRDDGAVAYFEGDERNYRAGVSYVGKIVVRSSVDAPGSAWTTEPGRYIVVGWAGSTLLAYQEHEGEALDLLALDGPGLVRLLAPDSGLVAISPDGQQALVEQGPASGRPTVSTISVSTGAERASLDLTTIDPAVGVVGYAGDWEGELAVAPSATGVAVFRIHGRRITLEQAVRTGAGGVSEPRFAAAGRHVIAWTSSPSGGAFLDCDRSTRRCAHVVPLPDARGVRGFPTWRRPAYNPSRPQEGEL